MGICDERTCGSGGSPSGSIRNHPLVLPPIRIHHINLIIYKDKGLSDLPSQQETITALQKEAFSHSALCNQIACRQINHKRFFTDPILVRYSQKLPPILVRDHQKVPWNLVQNNQKLAPILVRNKQKVAWNLVRNRVSSRTNQYKMFRDESPNLPFIA